MSDATISRWNAWYSHLCDAYRKGKDNAEVVGIVCTFVSGDWSKSDPPTDPAQGHYRAIGQQVWLGAAMCREFASEGTAIDVADLLNRAYWNGHEAAVKEMTTP